MDADQRREYEESMEWANQYLKDQARLRFVPSSSLPDLVTQEAKFKERSNEADKHEARLDVLWSALDNAETHERIVRTRFLFNTLWIHLTTQMYHAKRAIQQHQAQGGQATPTTPASSTLASSTPASSPATPTTPASSTLASSTLASSTPASSSTRASSTPSSISRTAPPASASRATPALSADWAALAASRGACGGPSTTTHRKRPSDGQPRPNQGQAIRQTWPGLAPLQRNRPPQQQQQQQQQQEQQQEQADPVPGDAGGDARTKKRARSGDGGLPPSKRERLQPFVRSERLNPQQQPPPPPATLPPPSPASTPPPPSPPSSPSSPSTPPPPSSPSSPSSPATPPPPSPPSSPSSPATPPPPSSPSSPSSPATPPPPSPPSSPSSPATPPPPSSPSSPSSPATPPPPSPPSSPSSPATPPPLHGRARGRKRKRTGDGGLPANKRAKLQPVVRLERLDLHQLPPPPPQQPAPVQPQAAPQQPAPVQPQAAPQQAVPQQQPPPLPQNLQPVVLLHQLVMPPPPPQPAAQQPPDDPIVHRQTLNGKPLRDKLQSSLSYYKEPTRRHHPWKLYKDTPRNRRLGIVGRPLYSETAKTVPKQIR